MTQDAFLYDALRTPRGAGKPSGSLHEVKPIDLVVGLTHALRDRHEGLDPADIEDMILGCVSPVGDQGAVLPRVAALKAGLPQTVAGVQLNRFCASGLEAVNQAAARIRSGWESLLVAGGVESMSRVPMGSDGGAWAMDPATSLATDFVPQGVSADLIATREGFSRAELDCASGLEAVNQAAARIRSGWESLLVAGGVESMSRVPMGSDGGAWAMDPATSLATDFVPQGVSADLIATREGFSRAELDRFAAQSHRRAAAAWQEGRFARSVVPVTDMNGMTVLDRDETIRPDSTVETLATLKPSFEALGREAGFDAVALEKYSSLAGIEHLHHPGNSSGIVDGAALTLIGSEEAGRRAGMSPRARIVSAAVVGSEPTIMLTGPTPACRKALEVAGMTAADIDLVEINEAFAAVPLLLMKEMGWTEEQTNVNGGAIAMGHPLGATGAMILGTLVDELERRDLRTGIATLCIGAGMGVATIVERV